MPGPADPRGLPGWPGADPGAALAAYLATCDLLGPDWPRPGGDDRGDPEGFFARAFAPLPPQDGLLTGYFEPELAASPAPTGRFRHPLHAAPPGLPPVWLTRAEIGDGAVLAGHEIAWLDDPLEAFLVHVQGSARLCLPDGQVLRIGHAARNGHPYRSIGAELVARGAVSRQAMSLAAIRAWCAANPAAVPGLLATNPSYIFFRILDLDPAAGPLGAMGRPVTAGHSLAVDPAEVTLGAPVWLAAPGLAPRLCVAQDTGSAIKGRGRADLFCGSGAAAGAEAGALAASARFWPLAPGGLR